MVNIGVVGSIIELIALLLFFVVVYCVYRIDFVSSGFKKIWNLIALGFLLVIFRRTLGFASPFIKDSFAKEIISSLIVPIILLAISILFIIGFYQLDDLFERIGAQKLKKKR